MAQVGDNVRLWFANTCTLFEETVYFIIHPFLGSVGPVHLSLLSSCNVGTCHGLQNNGIDTCSVCFTVVKIDD